MKEDLKEQIKLLYDDEQYMELFQMAMDVEGGERYLAESYILQENPFAEIEPE